MSQVHPQVVALARLAERAAGTRPDHLELIKQSVASANRSGVDGLQVIGVLLDGAVGTMMRNVPAIRQREASLAMTKLLIDRLFAAGLWPDATG